MVQMHPGFTAAQRAAALRTPARPIVARRRAPGARAPRARALPANTLRVPSMPVPSARVKAVAVNAFKRNVSRSRLDYEWLPNGKIRAYLTVTLPRGVQFRFTGEGDPMVVAYMIRAANPQAAGVGFGFLKSIWKGAKKIAKKVATSSVFKTATKVLGAVAPVLGPIAPAALAAAGTMKASTMLLAAKEHAKRGNKAGAAKLVQAATAEAKKFAPKNPKPMLDVAQAKADRVFAMLLKPA